ncbi:hypothetical protein BDC45DRAFT_529331 [Circinella umbellata]|nr:hypothetical protein BDC45DRAFT_529331 [Circinella umbellata]
MTSVEELNVPFVPFADVEEENSAKATNHLHLRIQQRNGRKNTHYSSRKWRRLLCILIEKQLVPVFDVLSVEVEPAMTFSTTNTIAVIDISRAQLPSARKGSLFTQSPQELLEQSIWRICELCYKSCGSHGSSKALTVFKDDYQQVQKLCLMCRVNEYIETKPEVDLPRQLMTGVVDKTEGRKLFKISPDSFNSLNPVYQHTTRYGKPTYEYQLKDVARRAMIVHAIYLCPCSLTLKLPH